MSQLKMLHENSEKVSLFIDHASFLVDARDTLGHNLPIVLVRVVPHQIAELFVKQSSNIIGILFKSHNEN
jgi:hypothetical protein